MKIGIIGGSGVYNLEVRKAEARVETPGRDDPPLGEAEVMRFLPGMAVNTRPPHRINYPANVGECGPW